MPTVYDVTTFVSPTGTSPYVDIGKVINEIMTDIKASQTTQSTRPGAVIYIPPGHYTLQTTAVIDRSFITIKGSGHGFMSHAVRDDYGSPAGWVEIKSGSSHVQIANSNQVGFRVTDSRTPAANGRLNGIVFQDFCIDGISSSKPYLPGNGKIGISFEYDNDAVRIEGMGFVYLAKAAVLRNSDAYSITNNFVCEVGTCFEMLGYFIFGKVTNNYLLNAWAGYSIYAENGYGMLVSGNHFSWAAKIQYKGVNQTNISSNKFVSNFPGMIVHETNCHENLITANHFRREYGNGGPSPFDDLYGSIQIKGNGNQVTSNMFQLEIPSGNVNPFGTPPTQILVKGGDRNFLGMNHLRSNIFSRVVLDNSVTNTKVYYTCVSAELQDLSGGSTTTTVFTT